MRALLARLRQKKAQKKYTEGYKWAIIEHLVAGNPLEYIETYLYIGRYNSDDWFDRGAMDAVTWMRDIRDILDQHSIRFAPLITIKAPDERRQRPPGFTLHMG